MAIFKKETKEEKVSTDTQKNKTTAGSFDVNDAIMESVLRRPTITEKASALAEKNVYVFEVDKRTNKIMVKQAIKEIYNVSPIKVNIVNSPSKRVFSKGIRGVKSGKKKALVYLKKGDSIEII